MNSTVALVYRNIGIAMVIAGVLMLWMGLGFLAAVPILVGSALFLSQFIIEGTQGLIQQASHLESDWPGELLHTDSGQFKVRYSYDANGQPRFVASDVCRAIGGRVPGKGALKWGGAALLMQGEYACFSESAVQTYLIPLAINNHEANLLLTKLRNEVFRKLDKQREHERNASRASVF